MAPAAAIVGLDGTVLDRDEAAFLRASDPWGVIFFARNVHSPGQLRVLTASVREALGRQAPILIDQEGGRVQRMRAPHWREYLPALDQMARAAQPMRAQWLRNRLIAEELHRAGIDVNCAPLADLVEEGTHPVLRNRLYGTDIPTVIEAARIAAEALLDGGVLPVLKHIPGYGRARVDSHLDLPRVTASAEALQARDFAPFRALRGMRMGMTAHLVFEAIDPERAATVSPVMIRTIREEIGFGGLLMTDDLGMEALSGTPGERAAAAIAAGCDIALYGNGSRAQNEAVIAAAGPMGAQAFARAEAALAERRAPGPVDIRALAAELEEQLAGDG